MAPTRSPSAPSAELRFPNVMASGVDTPSRSLRAHAASAAIATTRAMLCMCFIILLSSPPLEGDVESEDEIARRRRGLEIRLGADRRSGVGVALRIDSRILRPFVEIARREDDAGVPRARLRHQALGQRPRRGELTEPRERPVLHEAELRVPAALAHGDGPRLHPQRRVLRVSAEAVVPALAPDALRSVQEAEASLVIERARDAQLGLEQVDAGLQRRLEAGRRVGDEARRI